MMSIAGQEGKLEQVGWREGTRGAVSDQTEERAKEEKMALLKSPTMSVMQS